MIEARKIADAGSLDAAFDASSTRPVFLFKHSLICPVSTRAHSEYQQFVQECSSAGDAEFTLIEIQNARPLSNAVAERTGVRHESPQALLLRDGKVVWHASHGSIRVETLEKALTSALA